MPDKPTKPGVPRKSAFSCEACRKRKVKCNGANPSCSRCAARGETCVYSLAPTLSYTKKLEERVAHLEAALKKYQGDNDSQSAGEDAQAIKAESTGLFVTEPTEEDSKEATIDLARDIDGLKVGDDGRISYHGPTSLFQLPSGLASEQSNATQSNPDDGRRERLINNAWRERAFEQLSTIPDPFQYLLDSHWCWIHPLFNFVYRPAFTRDMKLNGPYYSDVLMNAIISHSIRWCKDEPKVSRLLDSFDGGKQFFQRASSGLLESVKEGNGQIPNVQALLLLSAQECGRGNRTQAWVYSGMAFRLVEDLGITIDSRKYTSVQFSDEDVEIRNRLFWSCYFWDKLVSLYFGRSPIIQDTPVSPPRILLDDTAELEVWTPHGLEFPEGTRYPPAQAHSTSCFMKMCSLAEILNQIIIHIYDPVRRSSEHEFKNCVRDQGSKLEQWWEGLPSFLKLIVNDLPPFSPPSHIVTLNCLYHTVNILLHRPMLCSRPYRGSQRNTGNAKPLVQCISSATSIIALYDLYRRTFGDGHVVLSLAYSIYTAASIFLLEIQALKYASSGTVEKLRYCIIALNRVSTANPVINTALGLINAELQKLHINIADTSSHTPQPISPAPPSHVSPASSSSMDQAAAYTLPPHGAFSFTPPPLSEQPSQTTFTVDPTLSMPATLKQDDIYDISPELFEAFAYVDPMATTVSTDLDSEWNNNASL